MILSILANYLTMKIDPYGQEDYGLKYLALARLFVRELHCFYFVESVCGSHPTFIKILRFSLYEV